MENAYSNFLKTDDEEQIFYSTNFKPGTITKDVLVLNYGLVCSNLHWKEQIKFFEELGYHILIHDYRGHFQSSGLQKIKNISFERIAKDLKLIIDQLEITDCILVGHSMGVNVCLEFARYHQEMITKMILISGTLLPVHNIMMNTHITGPAKPILKKILNRFPNEFRNFWKYGGWTPPIKSMVRSGGFNPKQVDMDFIDNYLQKLGQLGPELFFQLLDQMQAHDTLAFIESIKTKTLVIGGDRDKVIPNFLQKLLLDHLDNSELYLIHSGSHVPQIDFPEFINERMQYFLEA